jgi:hypothetical protein
LPRLTMDKKAHGDIDDKFYTIHAGLSTERPRGKRAEHVHLIRDAN